MEEEVISGVVISRTGFAIQQLPILIAVLPVHLSSLIGVVSVSACVAAAPVPVDEDYNQWKRALTNSATAAAHITALPGFQVELVRSAAADEGSWVALAFDPRGRIVVAREDRGLLRFTPGRNGLIRVETINTNLLECRGLLFAQGALYANANNSKGLYRLRDLDGDDQFDEVELLKATPGGVGHGRNQLALGPDGMIYKRFYMRMPCNRKTMRMPSRVTLLGSSCFHLH